MNADAVLRLSGIETRYGARVIHAGIDLSVTRGEILAIVGGSGSGKTTLLREMLLLRTPEAGHVEILGQRNVRRGSRAEIALRRRMGVLFQSGALFGGLTVLENVCLPLQEHTGLRAATIGQIATLKIALTGLPPESAALYPSELSGGMRKRAALARALALDPELLFLDEPGSGLDPVSARAIDELVVTLRDALDLTVVMVTHDLATVQRIADRVILLGERVILASGTPAEMAANPDPRVRRFFAAQDTGRARLSNEA
ncbi:ABC transporter ATP-binding protein [Acidihalobacter ferrooxydans]|uniref:ABC transporter ATP-binding protein n=1 Tax=Acidihalobacter ferrooxydans TaxID=1765967 RepID=A0A1P8UHN3_9GAMM|nr:ATP-binding cassette domain-containing protein [Acidihalobacter ferrooxydans]APZ43356.1 ABC transporter ATP-binding protein [Acidihalobacter ferrooxydans]